MNSDQERRRQELLDEVDQIENSGKQNIKHSWIAFDPLCVEPTADHY